jgi:5-methylcytosine-specific restriction protein A
MPNRAITLSQIKNQTATPKRDNRPSAASRGYGARWRKARMYFLTIHPLCVDCEKESVVKSATVVDHIIPHKGNQELFWQMSNWQSLCKQHHDIKTATQDGGFGHKIKENN